MHSFFFLSSFFVQILIASEKVNVCVTGERGEVAATWWMDLRPAFLIRGVVCVCVCVFGHGCVATAVLPHASGGLLVVQLKRSFKNLLYNTPRATTMCV